MLCKVYTLHCTGNIPLIKLTKKYVLKEDPWNIHQEPFIFVYTLFENNNMGFFFDIRAGNSREYG